MSSKRAATVSLLLCHLALAEGLAAAEGDPVFRGRWPDFTRGPAYAVVLRDGYAFVAAQAGGLISLNVSNPSAPRRVGGLATGGSASDVAIQGNYAYVAAGEAGLQVIDITDPSHPRRIGGHSGIAVFGVAVNESQVFVASDAEGLLVFDLVASPILLEPLDPTPGAGFLLRVHGDAGVTVRVQRSQDLREWTDWQTVTLDTVPTELSDLESNTTPHRFYRAVTP